jgi:hypothetical protein
MIDYNNIQQIFGDPLNDFGHTETQGTSPILKIVVIILALGTIGYIYKKYVDEQYEKRSWVE